MMKKRETTIFLFSTVLALTGMTMGVSASTNNDGGTVVAPASAKTKSDSMAGNSDSTVNGSNNVALSPSTQANQQSKNDVVGSANDENKQPQTTPDPKAAAVAANENKEQQKDAGKSPASSDATSSDSTNDASLELAADDAAKPFDYAGMQASSSVPYEALIPDKDKGYFTFYGIKSPDSTVHMFSVSYVDKKTVKDTVWNADASQIISSSIWTTPIVKTMKDANGNDINWTWQPPTAANGYSMSFTSQVVTPSGTAVAGNNAGIKVADWVTAKVRFIAYYPNGNSLDIVPIVGTLTPDPSSLPAQYENFQGYKVTLPTVAPTDPTGHYVLVSTPQNIITSAGPYGTNDYHEFGGPVALGTGADRSYYQPFVKTISRSGEQQWYYVLENLNPADEADTPEKVPDLSIKDTVASTKVLKDDVTGKYYRQYTTIVRDIPTGFNGFAGIGSAITDKFFNVGLPDNTPVGDVFDYVYQPQVQVHYHIIDKNGKVSDFPTNMDTHIQGDLTVEFNETPKDIKGYTVASDDFISKYNLKTNQHGFFGVSNADPKTNPNHWIFNGQFTPDVNFYYLVNSETQTTHYYLEDSKGTKTTTSLSPDTQQTGDFGTSYTTSATPVTGYTVVTADTVNGGSQTYAEPTSDTIYYYKANAETQTTHYYLVDSKGSKTETKVSADTTQNGDFGSDYTTSAAPVTGYTVVTADTVNGGKQTYKESTPDTIYYYTVNPETQTTHYYLIDSEGNKTKTKVSADTTQTGDFGSDYTTSAAPVTGYTAVADDTVNGGKQTYKESTPDTIYYYTVDSETQTTHYYLVDGKGIKTTTKLSPDTTQNGNFGAEYTTSAAPVNGYTAVAADTVNGGKQTYTVDTPDTIYYYAAKPETQTTHYYLVDAKGVKTTTKLSVDTTQNGLFGDNYTTSSTNIPGYTVVSADRVNGGQQVYTESTPDTDYYYTINHESQTTHYYLIDGNGNKTEIKLSSDTKQNGDFGSAYSTTPVQITGYTLVSAATVNGGEQKYGENTPDTIYYYVANPVKPAAKIPKTETKTVTSQRTPAPKAEPLVNKAVSTKVSISDPRVAELPHTSEKNNWFASLASLITMIVSGLTVGYRKRH